MDVARRGSTGVGVHSVGLDVFLDLGHETEVYAKPRECPRVGHLHVRRLRVSRKDGDGVFIQRYNPSEDAGSLHPARK